MFRDLLHLQGLWLSAPITVPQPPISTGGGITPITGNDAPAFVALPSYQVNVYDPTTGDMLRIFDPRNFYEMSYERLLWHVGKLAIVLPYELGIEDAFPVDALIDILRTSPVTGKLELEDTYLCRLTQRFVDDGAEQFAVGGLHLNHLFDRRIIDPADDPAAAGGYSTKAGAADNVIRAYVREQMGDLASTDRNLPNFTVSPVPGTGHPVGARKRYDNLLATLQELSAKGDMDFVMQHLSSNVLYCNVAVMGTDKTRGTNYPLFPYVGLAPERGNLEAPSLTLDRKEEGNVVYMLGEGNRENRSLFVMSGSGAADSPYNRIEFTKNAQNSDKKSPLELVTDAFSALRDSQPTTEFTFKPVTTAAGSIYQLDWILGDKVTVSWGAFEQDVRITGVNVRLDSEGEDIEVTIKDV